MGRVERLADTTRQVLIGVIGRDDIAVGIAQARLLAGIVVAEGERIGRPADGHAPAGLLAAPIVGVGIAATHAVAGEGFAGQPPDADVAATRAVIAVAGQCPARGAAGAPSSFGREYSLAQGA